MNWNSTFTIREAIPADVPALAALHVTTFNETHGTLPNGPTYELREHQWRKTFESADNSWFCFVIENVNKELVGFAKGMLYQGDLAGFSGELNKIYLLKKYHRQGLGRQLIGAVARRFFDMGISSMLLFGDAANPSNGFYETLNAENYLQRMVSFMVAMDGKIFPVLQPFVL